MIHYSFKKLVAVGLGLLIAGSFSLHPKDATAAADSKGSNPALPSVIPLINASAIPAPLDTLDPTLNISPSASPPQTLSATLPVAEPISQPAVPVNRRDDTSLAPVRQALEAVAALKPENGAQDYREAGRLLEEAVTGQARKKRSAVLGRMTKNRDGLWEVAKTDKDKKIFDLLGAAQEVHFLGSGLHVDQVVLTDGRAPVKYTAKRDKLLVSLEGLAEVEAYAQSQNFAFHDYLVRLLIREYLRVGIPKALRLSAADIFRLDHGKNALKKWKEALRDFKRNLSAKTYALINQLTDGPTAIGALNGPGGRASAAAFSPDGKLTLLGHKNGTFSLQKISDGWDTRSWAGHPHGVVSAAFLPDGKRFFTSHSDGRLKLWGVPHAEEIADFPGGIKGAFAFSPEGKFIVAEDGDGSLALWDALSGEKIRSFEKRVVNLPELGRVLRLLGLPSNITSTLKPIVFSPDGRTVLAGGPGFVGHWDVATGRLLGEFPASSRVNAIAFAPDGRSALAGLANGDLKHFTWRPGMTIIKNLEGSADFINSIAFLPDGRKAVSTASNGTLKLWGIPGRKLLRTAWINPDGRAATALSRDGKLLLSGSLEGRRTLWDISHWSRKAKRAIRPSGPLIDAVAFGLTSIKPRPEIDLFNSIAGAAREVDTAKFRRSLWARLRKFVMKGSLDGDSLATEPNSARWFKGEEEQLKARMPTLWDILQDAGKLRRFLFALSFLRAVYPYDAANKSEKTSIAWAREKGLEFKLKELTIVPVSESFRRHIFYVDDEKGRFAVELKIPGEAKGRKFIYPEHFTVAKQLWDLFPNDPGVVKPIYFGEYSGHVQMYGVDKWFAEAFEVEPMGLMLFEYEEGKRLWNADGLIKKAAADKGVPQEKILRQALARMAVTAIRMHRLGWRGSGNNTTDMHGENIRVLQNGEAVLAGDFGNFELDEQFKSGTPEAMKIRSEETLLLLNKPDAETLREIYPLVVSALLGGNDDAELRLKVEEEVRQELKLP